MTIHPEYLTIFAGLESRAIKFCLLRNDLVDDQIVADLDLLVDEKRLNEVLQYLADLNYRIKVTQKYNPYKTVLVKYYQGRIIVIDLHCRVVQCGIEYIDTIHVLDQRKKENGYYLPCDPDFLSILVLHNVIGKGQIQDKHVPDIERLVKRIGVQQLKKELPNNNNLELLVEILENLNSYVAAKEAVQSVRCQIIQNIFKVNPSAKWRNLQWRLMRRWRQYSPFPKAPMYAMLGVDGAGKSSLNEALLDALNHKVKLKAVSIYMGPWGHYQLIKNMKQPFNPNWSITTKEWFRSVFGTVQSRPGLIETFKMLAAFLNRKKLDSNEKELIDSIRRSSRIYVTMRYFRTIYTATRFFVLLIIEMYYRYFKAFKLRRRGVIVITDRYMYDLLTGRMHEIIPQYKTIRRLLCKLFFKPTSVFYLTIDNETILERKKDLSLEELCQFKNLYEDMAEQYGFDVITTNKPPNVIAQQIIEDRFDEIIQSMKT